MPNLVRGFTLMMACAAGLAVAGCAEDNEAFVRAQAEANKATDKTSASTGPVPRNQTDYFKQQQERQAGMFAKGSGYPGVKRKPQ